MTKYLSKVLNNAPAKMDSTEAYLRHRERVRERERLNKLARYRKRHPNAVIPEDKPKKEEPKPEPEEDENDKENLLDLYNELKKLDEIEQNKIKLEILEAPRQVERKSTPKPLVKKKAPKHKKKVKKAPKILDIDDEEDEEIDVKFTPKMAGQTGLPVFFFSNLVKNSRSAFLDTFAKNKVNYKKIKPKLNSNGYLMD